MANTRLSTSSTAVHNGRQLFFYATSPAPLLDAGYWYTSLEVAWSVRTTVSYAITAEPIEMHCESRLAWRYIWAPPGEYD